MSLQEEKVNLLRKLDIFTGFREYELDIIANYSEFINTKKGDVIFKAGSPANELYAVDKGRVGIINVNEDAEIIAQITNHESFGELDLFGKTQRKVTAFCEEDTMLLRFPSRNNSLDTICHKNPYFFANILFKLLGIISERIWNVNKLLFEKSHWLNDLHKQLLCDKMTGLYNQNFLKEDFINLLPDLGRSAALLMIKPDNFKEINDRFSHETGDKALNMMAIFLQSELNENEIGIRYRGDEYAAILMNCSKSLAKSRAENIKQTLSEMDLTNLLGSDELNIQISMGIAMYPGDTDNSQKLVNLAHQKMMQARESGGNVIIL